MHDRFLGLLLFIVQAAQIVQGRGIGRPRRDDLLQLRDRLGWLAHLAVDPSLEKTRLDVLRIPAQQLVEEFDRLVERAFLEVQLDQAADGVRVVGIDLREQPLVDADRLGPIAPLRVEIAERDVCVLEELSEFDRLFELRDRLIPLVLPGRDLPEIQIGRGGVRFDCNGAADDPLGVRVPLEPTVQQAQVQVGFGLLRLQRRHVLEQFHGAVHPVCRAGVPPAQQKQRRKMIGIAAQHLLGETDPVFVSALLERQRGGVVTERHGVRVDLQRFGVLRQRGVVAIGQFLKVSPNVVEIRRGGRDPSRPRRLRCGRMIGERCAGRIGSRDRHPGAAQRSENNEGDEEGDRGTKTGFRHSSSPAGPGRACQTWGIH